MSSSAKKWLRLDNAAKIYPAASSRKWSSVFRFSMSFTEDVDAQILQQALRRLQGRIPVFFMRLRRGMFWYFLEQSDECPDVVPELPYPCAPLTPGRNGGFSFRVLYYKNRIALEVFHVIADGTGGMCFLKTLVAEYLTLRYGANIPRDDAILCCDDKPKAEEQEDSFLRHARDVSVSRSESSAFHMAGKREEDFVHLTTGMIPAEAIKAKAKEYGVSVNTFLVSVMIESLLHIQKDEGIPKRLRRPVKICVPVNLRKMFPSKTLRNFSSFINPGIDARLAIYDFADIAKAVYFYMGTNAAKQQLEARFSSNVLSEKNKLLRLTPLFLKDLALKMAFITYGDTKSSTTITNIGEVTLPEEMKKYVTRMDMVLGPLNLNPVSCAVLTYDGTLYFSIVRVIQEPTLEREFFTRLVKMGLPVKIESNEPSEEG